ncbi:MAG: DsbA family protein [Acidobacteriota bacterium]|nr:MAG: DsbA family protein [Acidobacteriota bacterium]
MKLTVVMRTVIATAFVILLFGFSRVNAQTPSTDKTGPAGKPASQRESIEQIVREYLLKNPAVIREAMQALQAQEEIDKRQKVADNLKALESDLYQDPRSPTAGNPNGDVTIVAFFDYNCGYCKKTLPALQSLLSKDHSIRVVYKEFPILSPDSQIAALAALAADKQGKYSAFHLGLMESDSAGSDAIKGISDRLGLNYATLQHDMNDPGISEALNRNFRLASALEIQGTPAYIIGGQIIPGAIDADSLAQVVSDERARLKNAKAAGEFANPSK